jgi:hypothetical protein
LGQVRHTNSMDEYKANIIHNRFKPIPLEDIRLLDILLSALHNELSFYQEMYNMTTIVFSFSASIPSVEEFGTRFPQYKPYALGEGETLFKLLMRPESLNSAIEATKLGLPAVAGVAEISVQEVKRVGRSLSAFDKQFIGGVVCCLMEANGYQKTGTKRAIPHKDFSKGEFYVTVPAAV